MAKIKCTCANCGNEIFRFPSQILETTFCSRSCRSEFNKKNFTEELSCLFCNKKFRKRKANIKGKNHFCSRICKDKWQKEGLKGKNNPFYSKVHTKKTINSIKRTIKLTRKTGVENPLYRKFEQICEICNKKYLTTPYLSERSQHHYCSIECHAKGKSIYGAGKNNPNYNSSLSDDERAMKSRSKILGYKTFRLSVLKRDNERCVICGGTDNLIVHHLNSHHWDKKNRVNPDNGVCLCEECHKDFHKKFGYKNNTKEQFKEYEKSI
mgnify:FL=1